MKRSQLLLAVVSVGVLVAACGGGATSSSSQASGVPYQVGISTDLSGVGVAFGNGQLQGMQAWAQSVNKAGGINGHDVTINALDDNSKPDRAVANITQLATQGASVIEGFSSSNSCVAAAPILTARNVPALCISVPPSLLTPVHPDIYIGDVSAASLAMPAFAFAQTLVTSSAPKIGVMALNTSGQIPYHQAVLKLAGSRGWNVVSDQSITYGASDLTVEIGKVVAAHPDILITSLDDNSVILLMHGLKAAGISVPVIDTTALGSLSTFAQLADPNLYAMSAVAWDVPSNTTAGMKKLIAGASAAGVQPTLQYFNHGWLDGLMVGAALSACGFPCSGAQAQKALDKLNLDTQGVTPGPVTFSTSDHQGLHAASVYHWDATSASVTAVKENLPTGSV